MSESTPSIRARFAALASAPESELDLASAALLVAAEEYPQLLLAPYLRRLDLLAERVHDRLGDETAPLIVFQELNRVLFADQGFRGNVEAYYDVRNSFLNDVLDRRVGIPITLSVVYLEVGWRLSLPLIGVGFPGHFLMPWAAALTTTPSIRSPMDAAAAVDSRVRSSSRTSPPSPGTG